jgi:hypothetical protein
MIEGLKIQIGSQELKMHILGRAAHHREKTEWYAKQINSLKQGHVSQTGASNDPIASLEQSRKSHNNAATFFKFLAHHLVGDEIYQLSENDLTRIEILDRMW